MKRTNISMKQDFITRQEQAHRKRVKPLKPLKPSACHEVEKQYQRNFLQHMAVKISLRPENLKLKRRRIRIKNKNPAQAQICDRGRAGNIYLYSKNKNH